VSSWREIASQQAQEDLDGLVGVAINFAQQQLASHGEFFPFAAAVTAHGAVEMIEARPDNHDERPPSADVLAACVTTLRSRRADIRACATTADVSLRGPQRGDAIQVDLEHLDGHALTVVLPYVKKRRRDINYGPIQAHAGPHRVWEPPDR
jgi:hypothetical protein